MYIMMHWSIHLYLIFLVYIVMQTKEVSCHQRWHFPKFNLNPNSEDHNGHLDDSEKMLALLYDQAMTGLMAVIGTGLQKQLSPTSRISINLEQCTRKSENSIQFAKCLKPVIRQKRLLDQWRKNREYRKLTENMRRKFRVSRQAVKNVQSVISSADVKEFSLLSEKGESMEPQSFQENIGNVVSTDELENGKPILVELADWLTGAVRYIKANIITTPQPVVIKENLQIALNDDTLQEENGRIEKEELAFDDEVIKVTKVEDFVKRLFGPALNTSGLDGFSLEHFTRGALLSNMTKALHSFLNIANINNPMPIWQIEFLQDVHQLVTQITQQTEHIINNKQNSHNLNIDQKKSVKLLSPRVLPLDTDQQEHGSKFLSPDILSFSDNGIASIPQILNGTVGDSSKESWLRFIMEASGVGDRLSDHPKLMDSIIKSKNGKTETVGSLSDSTEEFTKVYQEVSNKLEYSFKRLYRTFSTEQIENMEDRGFAYLSRDQIDYIYNSRDSPCAIKKDCHLTMDIMKYEKMTRDEKDDALLDFILELADTQEIYREPWTKRNKEKRPKRRWKRTALLKAVTFSPVIKNPKAASMPVILSTLLFSPTVLSPSLLGPVVLSPALFSPTILSPLILGAVILAPFIANPVILSPLVLFPFILRPHIMNPFILSPYVLTPLILSPNALSPTILAPNVLSPSILDPGVLSPTILSPNALSPVVLSPQAVSAVILSPYALSPSVKSPTAVFASILSPNVLSGR